MTDRATPPARLLLTRRGWLGAAAGLPILSALGLSLRPTPAEAQQTIRAHGISPFGNMKYGPDFAHLDYVNPEAPKGGEISIWAFGGFDSMNPYTTLGRAAALASSPYESLLTGTADETNANYGLLAESLEYPEDRSFVIFTLRAQARFADGSPVTVEDIRFSFETFRDKGLPSFRAVLGRAVEKAEILDERRIRFTFRTGETTRDLPQMVGGLPIFSKADFEANGHDLEKSSLTPFLGSGPYALESMETGRRLVYARTADYWGAELPINRGRNNFDRIRVEYYADYNAAFEGFKAGSYTFRNEASSKSWATGYDFPAIAKGWVKKEELPDGSIATGQSFVFNLRRPQFRDIRVREAIGLMFNFEWSNETLFYGLYARIRSFWENSDLAASGPPSEAERALLEPLAQHFPEGILTEPAVIPPESGNRQLDRGNLRKASRLLSAAGWEPGDDGVRRKDGEPLRVEFLNDSPSFDRVINPYVRNLRALGIDAKLVRVDNAQFTNRERSYEFDIITAQFPMNYVPGNGLKQYFGSETADDSVFNKMGLRNEGIDKLIRHVVDAQSQEDLTVAVHALDRALRSLRFWVPQWFKDVHTVAWFDMYRHPQPLPPYALGALDFWWYDADRASELIAAGALQS